MVAKAMERAREITARNRQGDYHIGKRTGRVGSQGSRLGEEAGGMVGDVVMWQQCSVPYFHWNSGFVFVDVGYVT